MPQYMQHNGLWDLTANMMPEVYKDTENEPKLTPLFWEGLQGRMSNNSNKVRLDIRTRYFCELEKQSFFDLRVFVDFTYLALCYCCV